MKLADVIALNAGGPGSGPHPGGGIIHPDHKHLFEVFHKLPGAGRKGDLENQRVTGNNRAHAERIFKENMPGAIGVRARHLATKDSAGIWRVPTLRVNKDQDNPFSTMPVDEWHTLEEEDKHRSG